MARQLALLDWRSMKSYHVRMIAIPISSFIIGMITNVFVIPTCVILSCLFSINAFAVEEKSALDNLYLPLPVKRHSIVAGRFMLSIVMGLLGLIISIPLMLLANQFSLSRYYGPVGWYLSIITISYLFFALLNLSTFPILFKLGYQKGKFWGYILPLSVVGILYFVFMIIYTLPGNELMLFNMLEYASANKLLINGGIAVLATILLIISFGLSRNVYSKRDF